MSYWAYTVSTSIACTVFKKIAVNIGNQGIARVEMVRVGMFLPWKPGFFRYGRNTFFPSILGRNRRN